MRFISLFWICLWMGVLLVSVPLLSAQETKESSPSIRSIRTLLGVSLYQVHFYPHHSLRDGFFSHEGSIGLLHYLEPPEETDVLFGLQKGRFMLYEIFGGFSDEQNGGTFYKVGGRLSVTFSKDPLGLTLRLVRLMAATGRSWQTETVFVEAGLGVSLLLMEHWSWAPLHVSLLWVRFQEEKASKNERHARSEKGDLVLRIGFLSFLLPLF